jgi:hypothetical protein
MATREPYQANVMCILRIHFMPPCALADSSAPRIILISFREKEFEDADSASNRRRQEGTTVDAMAQVVPDVESLQVAARV